MISTLPPENAAEACHGKFSAFFRTPGNFYKAESRDRLKVTCEDFNISCAIGTYPEEAFKADFDLNIYPADNITLPKRFNLEEDFTLFYPEEPKCAIAAYPYMIFNFWSNVVGGIDQNRQILRDIVKSTSRKRVIFSIFFFNSETISCVLYLYTLIEY